MTRALLIALLALMLAPIARAHPVVQHAIDVVISHDKVVVDARISMEQVFQIENGGQPGAAAAPAAPAERWPDLARAHSTYVLKHLHLTADGATLAGGVTRADPPVGIGDGSPGMANYHLEYALASKPAGVRLGQTFLVDQGWQAGCVVRVRQADQNEWQSAVITGAGAVEFGCTWDTAPASTGPPEPRVPAPAHLPWWPTAKTYVALGVDHILGWDPEAHRPGGLDHVLFVCALVLAVRSFWDLVKVVTAFTLAHTVTLTLSVVGWLGWLHVSGRLVESMIAGSIVAVALQNVLLPKTTRGRGRLAIAFAFGLFHGLGFAGGLKDAMAEMPGSAMATALVSFSAGVEIGHQLVVIPLFLLLLAARCWRAPADRPREWVGRWAVPAGSCVIALAGAWFLAEAIRG